MASGVVGVQRVSEKKLRDARSLRRDMTPAERILWKRLRKRLCGGFKFRRQQIIEGFVADFYCEQAQVVVEVDGSVHDTETSKKDDKHRENVFKQRGITVIRFRNGAVMHNVASVLSNIASVCTRCRKQSKLTDWELSRTASLSSAEANSD